MSIWGWSTRDSASSELKHRVWYYNMLIWGCSTRDSASSQLKHRVWYYNMNIWSCSTRDSASSELKHRVGYYNMHTWGCRTTEFSFISHSQLKKEETVTGNTNWNNCDKQLKHLNNSRRQQHAVNQRKLREIHCPNYCVWAWRWRLRGINPAIDLHCIILNKSAVRPSNTWYVTWEYGNSQMKRETKQLLKKTFLLDVEILCLYTASAALA